MYNGRHIPGYKDIVQIQYGTEEHVPHYGNYYGNLRRSEIGGIRRGRSQRSANPRNNLNIHFGRQIYSQNENYDAALNIVLNLLKSSFGKGHIGSASYRKVDTLKGRNEEFGFGNGNRFKIGINSKAQTSRNRKRYTDAHRSREESGYKTGNVYTNGNRFDGQQVNDHKGRNGQGFGRYDNKREYRNGLINQRGNGYKGRQDLVSIRRNIEIETDIKENLALIMETRICIEMKVVVAMILKKANMVRNRIQQFLERIPLLITTLTLAVKETKMELRALSETLDRFSGRNEKKRTGSVLYRGLF